MSEIRDYAMEKGIAAYRAGDLQTAGNIAETAIAENPNDLTALQLIASVHMTAGNYGTAVTVNRMVLELARAMGVLGSDHWYNLGAALHKTYNKAPALEALVNALKLKEDDADIHSALASYHITYADFEKAEYHARRAIEIDPDSTIGHSNLGMALLALDRWQEAWPHMEWRKRIKKKWGRPAYPVHEWTGQKVETLIIHGEQGLGDELFFSSLVPRVYDLADRVVIECNPRLVPLLRRSLGCEVYSSMAECYRNGVFGADVLGDIQRAETAHAEGAPAPILFPRIDADKLAICAMGSLPLLTGATRENCADNAYLQTDPARTIYWRARLSALAEGKPIIGVAWQGGTYDNHKALRNPPRRMFERLSPERYCLVSVQYTDTAASHAARMGMFHFQQAIDDIDEQAAIIRALDCLVSVAQTAMHIGGAVGTKTLALIGQHPKWDCGASGDSVPWWKSVKAIRQRDDDWEGVFDRLLAELGEKPSERKMARFGAVPDFSQLHIGGSDASPSDIRAAE